MQKHGGLLSRSAAVLSPLADAAPAPVRLAGPVAFLLLFSVYAVASGNWGALTGRVMEASGRPASGAAVELMPLGVHRRALHGFAGPDGIFDFTSLRPGLYYVQAGLGQRISPRRSVRIQARQTSFLSLGLPSLLGSVRLLSPGSNAARQGQDFRWILRTNASARSVLRYRRRVIDKELNAEEQALAGYVAFLAGSPEQAGSASSPTTRFGLSNVQIAGGSFAFSGDLGLTGQTMVASRLQAAWAPSGNTHSDRRAVLTVRQLPTPALVNSPGLRVITLDLHDSVQVGDQLFLSYGSALNSVEMAHAVQSWSPFLKAEWRFSPFSSLEYRFSTAVPNQQLDPLQDLSSSTSDPIPYITVVGNAARLQRAMHQELGYRDQITANDLLQAAVFVDHFRNAAVNGALGGLGALDGDLANANLLPLGWSGEFTGDGGAYGGAGLRIAYSHRLSNDISATAEFTDAPALAPNAPHLRESALASQLHPAELSAWTLKMSARAPWTHTTLTCSYRDVNGLSATILDPYDSSVGSAGAYANLVVRQQLPHLPFSNKRMEALAEFNNLLAQGYIPMLSSDGQHLYLVQMARSFRGGFSISF